MDNVKTIPKQCYNCTECNSTFDARQKLNKYTREQHEGKFVISPEKKSPRTKLKTNIIISNTNKEEFKEQATEDGEEMIVKIVTIDVKKIKKNAGSSRPNRTGNRAAEK